MIETVSSPRRPLVGRSVELAELSTLTGVVADDAPPMSVLLAGDAGVGKTRLLAELLAEARRAEVQVLVGHCLDFGDSALPYLPLIEIFSRLAADAPVSRDTLVAAHPAIKRLTGLRRRGDQPDPTAQLDRAELFEAVHGALEDLATEARVLVVIEDVHWADQSTRDLLTFLFTRGFDHSVSIVASYRSDDLHRRHPLRTVSAEWTRLPGVTRLQLEPLSDEAVRVLVRSIQPGHLSARSLHAIIERAEGNAFFAEELVGAAESRGSALPDDLADLLLVRLDRLDDNGRAVVRAASVAGRRVSHALLAHVVDLGPAELDVALRTAVEQNILVAVGPDGYGFRHALLSEAVYDDLLPGERVRLHAAYVSALSQADIPGTNAEMARHARAAHDLPTAIRASIAAGDDAADVAAPEAALHYQLALELVADGTREGAFPPDVDVVELSAKASESVIAAGKPHRAVDLLSDQLKQLGPETSDHDRARLLLALASAALLSETEVNALEVTTEALDLVPVDPPSELRAELLSAHARANSLHGRDDVASKSACKALELADALHLNRVAAAAATTLARLEERAGSPDTAIRGLEKAILQARADGDIGTELRAQHAMGTVYFEAGELGSALETFRTAAHRAREVHRPWAPYGLESRVLAGLTAYISGDWDAALSIVDISSESPPAYAEAMLQSLAVQVAAGRGDRTVLALMPSIRRWWEKEALIGFLSGGGAIDLHGDHGDLEEAIAAHDDLVVVISRMWEDDLFRARTRIGALMLGQLANAASSASGAVRANLVARGDRLADLAEQAFLIESPGHKPSGPEGVAWRARARAEHARLHWLTDIDPPSESDLIATWQAAVAEMATFGHEFELARSRVRLGAVLRAAGDTAAARATLDLARATAHRLRAEPLLAELRGLGSPTGSGRGRHDRREQDLTPREVEILALVAEGRSNAEIGRRLFISAKTVSVHVSNILAKLGVGGRTEAAAVARREGLVPGQD